MIYSIVITGGTGSLGSAVVDRLCKSGHKIRVIAKDKNTNYRFPDHVEVIYCDIMESNLKDLFAGFDIVIHMAAIAHINNPGKDMYQIIEQINVGGTKRVVEAVNSLNVKHLILTSTIGVYGNSKFIILDEKSNLNPKNYYTKSKLMAEKYVLAAKNKSGDNIGTVLRLATVYGPNDRGNFKKLILAIAKGKYVQVGKGLNRKTLIYEKDVGEAINLIIGNEKSFNNVFNLTDGKVHPLNEIVSIIYDCLGKKKPLIYCPESLARFGFLFIDKLNDIFDLRINYGTWTINKVLDDVAVSGDKFISTFGFIPKYDLQKGFKETIYLMKSKGEI